VFSLHIDTALGWRGEQCLVLHTVLGLRALGRRAALVAHPKGEFLRRLSEGHDLVPLAPRGEVDLSAAWRLSRQIELDELAERPSTLTRQFTDRVQIQVTSGFPRAVRVSHARYQGRA
jgi:hypothetical protein